jgi:hypothetical protein
MRHTNINMQHMTGPNTKIIKQNGTAQQLETNEEMGIDCVRLIKAVGTRN